MVLPKLWPSNLSPKGPFGQENPNFGNQIMIFEERFGLPNTIMFNEVELFYV